ncbi:MAG: choice-of-anchor tandem repeat GloVer-containing protein, partial [Terriglobales bacterium]
MRNKFSVGSKGTLLAMLTLTLLATSVCADGEKILHRFGKGSDGAYPYAGLIFDTSGNLYGTTFFGGAQEAGTVFELAPKAKGGWTEKVLYSFGGGTDGANPYASVVFDAADNLYGTTYQGGDYTSGTVFELTPNGSGGWTEKVLHSFGNGTDGADPYASLIFDTFGNLYGTTYQGGVYGLGTVFELTPKRGGWREKVVHSFGAGTDGANPYASLVFDAAGNLYGTTYQGGVYSSGTAFELTPKGGGGWREKILYSFGNVPDGADPYASMVFDT